MFQPSVPRFKRVLILGWRQCTELWIDCFRTVLKEGTFPPSQLLFVDVEQPNVIWSHVRTIGRIGQNLDGLLHWESQWPWLCGHWCYQEGEGTYWCQQLGAADVLILYHSQNKDLNIVHCSKCWCLWQIVNHDWTLYIEKKRKRQKKRLSLPTLKTSMHNWSQWSLISDWTIC